MHAACTALWICIAGIAFVLSVFQLYDCYSVEGRTVYFHLLAMRTCWLDSETFCEHHHTSRQFRLREYCGCAEKLQVAKLSCEPGTALRRTCKATVQARSRRIPRMSILWKLATWFAVLASLAEPARDPDIFHMLSCEVRCASSLGCL